MLNIFKKSLSLNGKPAKLASQELDLYEEYLSTGGKKADIVTFNAQEVTDFSSQYGSETSISYTAYNLAGRGSIFPSYGDFTQACVFRTYGPWWDTAPSHRDPFLRTPPSFCSQDYIELSFERKVFPLKLEIYETYHPGCVVRILACDRDAESDVDACYVPNRWKKLWEGRPSVTGNNEARCFRPKLRKCPFATNLIRLELCHTNVHYYTELDSVVLYGFTKKKSWNRNDSDTDDVDVDSHSSDIEVLQDGVNKLSLDIDKSHDRSCDKEHGHVTTDQNNGQVEGVIARQESEETIPSDNGFFDLLPEEVIQLILSFLDHMSLCRVARTCNLFHKHSYDALQYTELDLQPHWTQVSNIALDSLHSRSRHLQRLNLSWCHRDLVTHAGFTRLIETCGKTLTCLYLSSCKFVQSQSIDVIAEYCSSLRELDLDSCRHIEHNGFMPLRKLTKLQRLNLYRTSIDDSRILPIVRSCPDLKHLNLGSCNCIAQFDDVCIELAKHCRGLISLDLWRSRTVSHIGVSALATDCPDLQELDIGWCDSYMGILANHVDPDQMPLENTGPEVKSVSECIIDLVRQCRKMKKLFLTANRTICDKDLIAIAKHSSDLEQLDILGTRQVTADVAQLVLEKCKKLRFFDVSFCSDIDNYIVGTWKSLFPNVDIKKSFQN